MRHAGVSLACPDWPLCTGQVVPSLAGPTGVVFAHRLAALAAVVLLAWLSLRTRGVPSLGPVARAAFGLALLQSLSGALVVTTRLGLFSALGHAAIMAVLFCALALLARRALAAAPRYTYNAGPRGEVIRITP